MQLDLYSRAGRRQDFQPEFFAISIPPRQDAVCPARIVGIPPMEDFYIGGASVKLFLPVFKMNFPEIVDLALRGAHVPRVLVSASRRILPRVRWQACNSPRRNDPAAARLEGGRAGN